MSSFSTAVPDDDFPGAIDSASNLSVPSTVSFQLDCPAETGRPGALKEPLQKLTSEFGQMMKKSDEKMLWIFGKWKEALEKIKKLEKEKQDMEWELAERQLINEELQMKLDNFNKQTATSKKA